MTRASRTAPRGPFSPTLSLRFAGLIVTLALSAPLAATMQDEQPVSNDIVVPPHWSRYTAPTTYPEGTQLHIIQRGDTLWDLSNQYLRNPFLWPQLWDANRYIENPHLIYPGDPVRIPDVDVVRPEGVEPGEGLPGQPGGPGAGPGEEYGPEGGPGAPGAPGGPRGPQFRPAFEEVSIECAGYLREDADDNFRIFGSEEGSHKIALSTGDVVYLNRGMRDGINPGETYFTQRKVDFTWGVDGTYVRRSGWVRILAVQEQTALAEIIQACMDVNVGDYLKPFEPVPVPLLPVQPHATRLSPETGRMRGKIVASLDDLASLGRGYLVSIDVGQEDGVVPGNVFTVFRYIYDGAPRRMLGEIAVLTVQREHSTGRIMHSFDYMEVGDLVELK